MTTVLIAGIAGASLGTELLKCLVAAGRYRVVACDVSATAYGLFEDTLAATRIVSRENYIEDVLNFCAEEHVRWIVPGGEQPTVLLANAADELAAAGIQLVANHPELVKTFSDKAATFSRLAELGFPTPETFELFTEDDFSRVTFPAVIKPATGSGGSASVFLASDADELRLYAEHIWSRDGRPVAQEYIDAREGEFTVGVLSVPGGDVLGSVALRRDLSNKLSISASSAVGVISSGYSQGYIADFSEIRGQAEDIAMAIGSRGPINVQGRVRKGVFVPFEINPRLSASTWLRAMAGFNEIDSFIRAASGERLPSPVVREGYYLRSFTERFVAPDERLI